MLILLSCVIFPFSRYILLVRVSDASGEAFVSAFNEEGEKIIGCSIDELDKMKPQVLFFLSNHYPVLSQISKTETDFYFPLFTSSGWGGELVPSKIEASYLGASSFPG